jgi:hypothetical protein
VGSRRAAVPVQLAVPDDALAGDRPSAATATARSGFVFLAARKKRRDLTRSSTVLQARGLPRPLHPVRRRLLHLFLVHRHHALSRHHQPWKPRTDFSLSKLARVCGEGSRIDGLPWYIYRGRRGADIGHRRPGAGRSWPGAMVYREIGGKGNGERAASIGRSGRRGASIVSGKT